MLTIVVSFLHLSVPPNMLNELPLMWHWLMSTLLRSMSIPLVPLYSTRRIGNGGGEYLDKYAYIYSGLGSEKSASALVTSQCLLVN